MSFCTNIYRNMHWLCFSQWERKLVCNKSGITIFPEISQAKTLPDDILMKNSLRRRWSYNLALGLWNNWHEIQQSDLAAVSNSLPCLELRPSPQTGWHITNNTETQLSFCKTVKALLDFSPAHLYVYFCSTKLFFFNTENQNESQLTERKQKPLEGNTSFYFTSLSPPPTVLPGSRMETDRPATSLCRVN